MTTRLLLTALFLSLSADAEPAPREPPKHVGPLTVALVVAGPEVDESKVKACHDIFTEAGATVDASAPLIVRLQLGRNLNHLTIDLMRRGRLLDEAKPDWRMKVLCRDALASVVMVIAMDPHVQAAAAEPPPPPAQLALDLVGPEADYGKLERCRKVFIETGAIVEGTAQVRVQLMLGNGRNRLTVRIGPRVVVDTWRPGNWEMGQLCADAAAQGIGQYRRMLAATRPPPPPPVR
jgi:hypothetical protein